MTEVRFGRFRLRGFDVCQLNDELIDCPQCGGQLTAWVAHWSRYPVHEPSEGSETPRWGEPRRVGDHEPEHAPGDGALPSVVLCDDCGSRWKSVRALYLDREQED